MRFIPVPTLRLLSTSRPFTSAALLRTPNVPPSPYHALFSLGEGSNQYIIDSSLLKRNFLQAQRLAHPDTVAGQGAEATTLAGVNSAELNKAYQTLLSPLKRAEYLLSLRGITLEETEKLDGGDEDHAEFIMEVMEARSALEDAQSEDEVADIRRQNKARIQEEVKILEDAFAENNTESALKASIRLRYWEGLEAAARDLPDH